MHGWASWFNRSWSGTEKARPPALAWQGHWRTTDVHNPALLRSLGREAQLLFLVLSGADADEIIHGLLREDVQWDLLFRLARREKATQLLHQHFRSHGLTLPPAMEAHLRRLAMVAQFKQSYLEQRLTAVLEVLGGEGIEVLLLKGAALAQREYRSFGDRPMADLDLLLDASRAAEAAALLGRAGWGTDPSKARGDFYEGHHHLSPLDDDRGTGVGVELHTDLFFSGHPFLLTPALLWREAQQITVGTRVTYVPSPPHQILHLCLHFAWSHAMRSGSWRTFRDLHAVLSTHRIDWNSFIGLARESRGATCCYWTFRLARNLTGLEVPPEVLAALRPDRGEPVLGWLERHLGSGLFPGTSCPSVRMNQLLWEGAVEPRRSGHGAVRPWSRSEAAHAAFASGTPVEGSRKLGHHLHRLHAWRIYLRSVLQSPSPSGSPPNS